MKVFIATLGTETNTFAPLPTGLRSFEETLLMRGDATQAPANLFTEALHVWRKRAQARGWQVIESIAAFAQPAGKTVGPVWEALRDEVIADLERAGGADIVLIQAHGAMVAEGYDDCEGDLMARLRKVCPDAVLGLELDLHCHLTDVMVDACDVIVAFKEYPHTDATARAEEVFTLAADTAEGRISPVMRWFDCRMIAMYMTPKEPMRSYVDGMSAAEGQGGVLSLSLAHGFPWGDVPDVGTRMLAITDGDGDLAARTAEEWGRKLYAMREALSPPLPRMGEALDIAAAHNGMPVVLADMADNAGAGAPADSTYVLQEVLERGLSNVALGIYWDPVLTRICAEAGIGAELDIRLGGKLGRASGDPIDLRVTVRGHRDDMFQMMGEGRMPMGEAVWLEAKDGIDLVVNDKRTQCFSPSGFEDLGIDLSQKEIVVVKSTNHFYAGFAPIASAVHHVATPGAVTPDFAAIPFERRAPDWWPLVDDPLGDA